MSDQEHDIDPHETTEWLEAIEAVLKIEGAERAHYLLEKLINKQSIRVILLSSTKSDPMCAGTLWLWFLGQT
mgnify:CR=1 FL=1